jgi:hypothetical protein
MQIDKIIYFAILLKKCIEDRVPRPDSTVTRSFLAALHSYTEKYELEGGYHQNERSAAYLLTMSKELEIIYRNNKPTPWGTALAFFVQDDVPKELSTEFKIIFAKYFLLENFAFIRSLTDHIEQFRVLRDDYSWYRETMALPKGGYANTAFSVYIHALKIAYESSESIALQRRYLSLYRQAGKKGKTAKALFPKMKPPLGMMEDLNLLQKRKTNNNAIRFAEDNGHIAGTDLMKRFQDYKALIKTYSGNDELTSIVLQAYGYQGTKTRDKSEILSISEALYTKLADPVFNVCDFDTLTNILVVQNNLQGYRILESEVKQIILDASKKDRYKYQILPDRRGKYRFLKIKKQTDKQ